MTYGVPDLPLSGSTRDESTEVEHTMYNVFNKTICVCYYTNSSSGLLFIMCGYCYYLDPAAVRTCMQTNFTVHGQPPQFLIASAANDSVCLLCVRASGCVCACACLCVRACVCFVHAFVCVCVCLCICMGEHQRA